MAEITLEDNLKILTFHPAPGFDPLTASAAELDENGFPPRPTDAELLARYKHVFRRVQGRFRYIEPTFRVNRGKSSDPRRGKGGGSSDNWSGGVVYAAAGQSFRSVQGSWVVPNVYPTASTSQWYECSTWIGLDGDGSDDVCQAGVACDVFGTRSSPLEPPTIYPWHQWYPGPQVQITNLLVSAGDFLTMTLSTSSGAGSTSATVYILNITTGVGMSYVISAPLGTQLAGNSAEWIVEAPTVGGVEQVLADYGEVFFSCCVAYPSSGFGVIQGGTGSSIDMFQGGFDVSSGAWASPQIMQCQYED
jgi:hypothetical protein